MKRYIIFFVLFIFIETIIITIPLFIHSQVLQADESIEEYRKGDVVLKCLDANKSIPGCEITYTQVNHDFLFAANPMGNSNQYDLRYANLIKDAGINFSYILATWESIEPEPGKFEWGAIESYQNIEEQLSQEFTLMGGLALWMYRGSGLGNQFCPTYLDNMDFDSVKTLTYNHMYALSNMYKGKIDIWEFNEQNCSWANALNLTWRQKFEIYQSATSGIKDANPAAKIIYTSLALPEEFNWPTTVDFDDQANGVQFPEFLNMLNDRGITFDIIGLELYYSGINADGYIPPTLNINALSDLIDLYSQFDKPIFIRELSAPSEQVEGTPMLNGPWNEESQANYLSQVYTMAFSKALVKAIGWSYGVSDNDSFITAGGILDEDLNPKSSYFALKNLISSWTTTGSITSDEKGECTFSGFAGDYEITATAPDGRNLDTQIHIFEGQTVDHNLSFLEPPVADAGLDQTVDEGDTVTLNGGNSSDADGIIESYLWTQTCGPSVTLSTTTAAVTSFTAPNINTDEENLVFQLTVTDNDGLQGTDNCMVYIENTGGGGNGGGGGDDGGGGCFINTMSSSN